MSQRLVFEGNRKFHLTVAVEAINAIGADEEPRPLWGWILAVVVSVGVLAGFLMLSDGLPYATEGSVVRANEPGPPWQPRLECRYGGPQGHRSLWLDDTQICPAFAFLPWRERMPERRFLPPPPIAVSPLIAAPPLKPGRPARRPPSRSRAGSSGPGRK